MGIQGPRREIPGHEGHESGYPFGGIFSSFSYFGVSWGVSGTGLEKHAENVRNQILQNTENCVPVYTGAHFSFPPCHPEIAQF